MISGKFAHEVLNRLQVIIGLNDLIDAAPKDWHFYDPKTGQEIEHYPVAKWHLELRKTVRALAMLIERKRADDER